MHDPRFMPQPLRADFDRRLRAVDASRVQPHPSGFVPIGADDLRRQFDSSLPFAVEVNSQNLQPLLQLSMNTPVLLVVYSPTMLPASAQLADDLTTVVGQFEGRYVLGRINTEAQPDVYEALGVQSVPTVATAIQGRLDLLLERGAPMDELRLLLTELGARLGT